ncbi:MAG: cell wall hydrolase [Alphaproteobacteria bacterium]
MRRTESESHRLVCLLAAAIYVESAKENHGNRGNVRNMEAIAAVILNRARLEAENGAGGNLLERLCEEQIREARLSSDTQRDERLFRAALRIARRALAGVLEDPTEGATRFHAEDAFPVWAQGRTPAAAFGHHLYYREDA